MPIGLHEPQRAVDLPGDRLVAAPFRRARHELLVPRVHLREVGEAALREGTQQVEGGDGLVVRLHHPLRVGHAGLGQRLVGVDGMAAERRQLDPVDDLGLRAARLRELTGDAADLYDRQGGAVGEHGGHLQEHLQPLADAGGGVVPEGLRAVAGLEQERAALRRLAERRAQGAGLAGEDEGWKRPQQLADGGDRSRVGPGRLLHCGPVAPGGRRPRGLRRCHLSSS